MYKVSTWLNTSKMMPVYGIIKKVKGTTYNVSEGNRPLFFENEDDAKKKAKELNKRFAKDKPMPEER